MVARSLVSCFLVLSFVATSLVQPAQAQVTLKHKFSPGRKYAAETTVQIDQTLTIAGMDIETKAETNVVQLATNEKPDENGNINVKTKLDSLRVSISAAGMDYQFDSKSPDDKGTSQLEMIRGIHKAIVGMESTVVYDAKGRVSEVKIEDNRIASLPVETQKYAASQLDPEHLKKQANQVLDQLPDQPVKVGDTWTRTETADLGASQVMTFEATYTYEGTVDQNNKTVHKITKKVTSASLSIGADSPVTLKLKESKLKPEKSSGELLFDNEDGSFVSQAGSVQIVGDLTFEAGGNELPAKLDLTMKSQTATR